MKNLLICMLLLIGGNCMAQKEMRKPVPWPYLREADVAYSKRVIRMIDTREKMNYPLRWPKNPLNRLLYEKVLDNTLTAFPNDDSLALDKPLDMEVIAQMGTVKYTIEVPDDVNDPYGGTHDSEVTESFRSESIVKFYIMEDWIFDKKTSEFFPRIVAIAPIYRPIAGSSMVELPEQPMFWIRYEQAREVLVNYDVFNPRNDRSMSFDALFEMRMFHSYIVKENNMYDYYIKDFDEFRTDGYAALLESERIQNELFEFEHDLWEF